MKFESEDQFSIRSFAGGVNAVSGLKPTLSGLNKRQDYVATPNQCWIDGVATKADLVRQFVAVPIMQFEVVRRKSMLHDTT